MAGDSDVGHDQARRYPEHYRAGDDDRQRVADRLREALDAGRLTLTEYDERLGATYGAQTYGELAKVTQDLPETAAPPTAAVGTTEPTTPAKKCGQVRRSLVKEGRDWLGGAVITNGIWAFTGMEWSHYWPGAVMGIWALAILGGAISGKSDHRDRRNHRTRLNHRDLTGPRRPGGLPRQPAGRRCPPG